MCDLQEVRLLGSGGYGGVKEVIKDNKKYAFKIIFKGVKHSLREIDVLFRIKNNSLIRGYEIRLLEEDEKCEQIYVFEKKKNAIRGRVGLLESKASGDLYTSDFFQFGKLLPEIEQEVLNFRIMRKFLAQTSNALICLISGGYYHLDVKTENILFRINTRKEKIISEEEVNFFISDYGILMPLDILGLPKKYSHFGTPSYQPYETLKNGLVTSTSCVWSLGLTLFQMIFNSLITDNHSNHEIIKNPNQYVHIIKNTAEEKISREKEKIIEKMKNIPSMYLKDYNLYLETLDLCLKMLTIEEEKRMSLFQIRENIPEYEADICDTKNEPLTTTGYELTMIFNNYLQLLFKDKKFPNLNVFCLSFSYIVRLLSAKKISIYKDNNDVFRHCFYLAKSFYYPEEFDTFSPSSQLRLLKYIKILDGKLYTNQIYINANNPDEIFSAFDLLRQGRSEFFIKNWNEDFKHFYKNSSVSDKNVPFQIKRYI